MRYHHSLLLVSLLSAPLASVKSQTVWIVDGNGGGQFTSIVAAAQAANDGDIILVNYWSGLAVSWDFVLTKGLTIVGVGAERAEVLGHLVIQGLAAHQRVVLRSLRPTQFGNYSARVTVQQCASSVVLDDMVLNGAVGVLFGDPGLTVIGSSHVAVGRSGVFGNVGLVVNGSTVTCTGCQVAGSSVVSGPGAVTPGVSATNSTLWCAASRILGGSNMNMGAWSGPGENGFELVGTTVTVADCVVNGGHGLMGFATSVNLDAGSVLMADAATLLRDGVSGAGSVGPAETGSIVGGVVVSESAEFGLEAARGDFAVLAVSLLDAGAPTAFGPVWLAPATVQVLAVGAVPVRGWFATPRPVPHGYPFVVQGAVLHQGVLRLSAPVVTTTR